MSYLDWLIPRNINCLQEPFLAVFPTMLWLSALAVSLASWNHCLNFTTYGRSYSVSFARQCSSCILGAMCRLQLYYPGKRIQRVLHLVDTNYHLTCIRHIYLVLLDNADDCGFARLVKGDIFAAICRPAAGCSCPHAHILQEEKEVAWNLKLSHRMAG